MGKRGLLCALALGVLSLPPAAGAATGSWLPHPADATWTYQWSDSQYAPTATSEQVTVKSQTGPTFVLAWTTDGLNNPPDAVSTAGTMSFQQTNNGIVNTDWTSTTPPPQFPVLCPQTSGCGNSLSSVLYNVIWGSRQPVLYEPLAAGAAWSSSGGQGNDVTSTSVFLGDEQVTVPAFPAPVTAAVVRTKINQAGALGDPYGSGLRTIWWVYGVGPVKIVFRHAGGGEAPVTTAVLQSTNQTALPPPPLVNYFPMRKNLALKYSWTNTKYLKTPEVQSFTVDAVVNATGRFKVASVSGPIKVAGSYGFSERLDGVTNLWGTTQSATTLKFPPLGPVGAKAGQRNHFVTPFDLMSFGFNPLIPAYAEAGDAWASTRGSNDFETYGVTGASKVVGVEKVTVPAGTFEALKVVSTLKQPGFPYGSGTRTCWFAPGKGLVKLVFDHGDGSVSTVVLVK
jgi:hypothetical protein